MKDSPQTADTYDLPHGRPPEGNHFAAIRAVTGFQLNRLMTKPRIAMGLVGALFLLSWCIQIQLTWLL